jgi:hypothetical protein
MTKTAVYPEWFEVSLADVICCGWVEEVKGEDGMNHFKPTTEGGNAGKGALDKMYRGE